MTRNLTPQIEALRGPILITGASGFVGANLMAMLRRVRSDVHGLEKGARSYRLSGVPPDAIVTVDLTDDIAVRQMVETIAPQTVFDCAAYGAYAFEQDSKRIYDTNFIALTRFVALLAERPIAAFVHAGSSSEYGLHCEAPGEDAECAPNSDYAVSKLAAAEYLRYMGRQRRFPCVNLRLYSVYGPLEETSRLIPQLVRNAQAARFPPLVDAQISRDFVYIDDVCAAFISCAAQMRPQLYGESFNIGTGTMTTIGDLAALVKRTFDVPGEPAFGSMDPRAWDVPKWFANPQRAAAMLGWKAEISLEAGLRETARWIADLSDERFETVASKAAQRPRSLSAIVACYKDEEAIPEMHERLTAVFRTLGIDYEIIFVNDGSPDASAQVIREISALDPHVIGITHSRNFGSQMAFRSGMELAGKDGVVLLDGDLQDPPELIEAFYRKWCEGSEVVYGTRAKREMPVLRGLLHKLFYRVFSAFSYVPIPLDAGDFSLIDRRVVQWILNCPERDLFVRGLRAYVGFRQSGVDYTRPARPFGRSTNDVFKNIEWAKRGIFSFSNAPLTMLTASGVVLLAASLLLALIEVLLRAFIPTIAPKGITTVLVAILFFGSLNLFAVGLVGEYVAKIMIEVKGRPRMIRSALTRNGAVTELVASEPPR